MSTTYRMLGQICVKVYYCGADGSGKAASVKSLHGLVGSGPSEKTQLVTFVARNDRTIFFTFMPHGGFDMSGLHLRAQIYALSHQVKSNTPYGLMLGDADGIIFVVDSRRGKIGQSARCFLEVAEMLRAIGRNWNSMPYVLQYNKRDLPDAVSLGTAERAMRSVGARAPSFESAASRSQGIVEPFDHLLGIVKERLVREAVLGPVIVNGINFSSDGAFQSSSA